MNSQPWPGNLIANEAPTLGLVNEFERAVLDAKDERPLQKILAANPVLLRPLLPSAPEVWCFDRPRFGSELVPDFLLCYRNSMGFNWIMVELESPTKRVLTAKGRASAALSEALGQINDWRIWLRQNIAYATQQLGFTQIDAECPGWIILGRRHQIDPKHALIYRQLSSPLSQVMSYDRVIDIARSAAKLETKG